MPSLSWQRLAYKYLSKLGDPFPGYRSSLGQSLKAGLRAEIERAESKIKASPSPLFDAEKGPAILHISDDESYGGAALLANRLSSSIRAKNCSSRMIVGRRRSADENIVEAPPSDWFYDFLCQKEGLLDWDRLGAFRIPELEAFGLSHILHLHNLHKNYFSPFALPALSALRPVVWTLHDMQAVTGHCGFSLDCKKWQVGCKSCPHLELYPALERDSTADLWQMKKELYESSKLLLVVPSRWLRDIVKKSILGQFEVRLIYNGVDETVFKPSCRKEGRAALGLSQEERVICTLGYGKTTNPYKGAELLPEILAKTAENQKITVVNIGESEENKRQDSSNIKWIDTGRIESDQKMAATLAAADVFLYPTRADNCPLMVLEAMSSGVPVVTFDVGGLSELVDEGETGFLLPFGETQKMSAGLLELLADKELRQTQGRKARKAVEERFRLDTMVDNYLDLYTAMLENRANS